MGGALPSVEAGDHARRFRSNVLWVALGEGGSKVFVLAANLLLARALQPVAFGTFNLVQSLAQYLWVMVGMGTPVYGVREAARDRASAQDLLDSLLSMRCLVAVSTAGILFLALTASPVPAARRWTYAAGLLYLIALAPSPDWVLRGFEQFRVLAMAQLVAGVALVAGATAWVTQPDHLPRAAGLWVASQALAAVILGANLRRATGLELRLRWAPTGWAFHLRRSRFFMVSAMTRLGAQVAPLVTLHLLGAGAELGHYSASYKVVVLLAYAGGLLASAGFPILSELGAREDRAAFRHLVVRAVRWVAVLGLVGAGALTLASGVLFEVAFGSSYALAAEIFRWMVWYLPLFLVRSTLGPALLALGEQRLHARYSFLGFLVGVSASPVMFLAGGAPALSVAWVASEAVLALMMGDAVRRRLGPVPKEGP